MADSDGAATLVKTPSGVEFPLTAEPGIVLVKVLEAQPFKDWIKTIDEDALLTVRSVHVQSVDMFGPRVGFLKFRSTCILAVGGEDGEVEVPGIVFMRGGAVGVLVILECDGQEYTIMTHQARVPIGTHNLPEIPAGMLDGSGNFRGVAANELAEECDIVIPPEELIDMTELAYGSRWTGMLPSAGGCDEFIRLFVFRKQVDRGVLAQLQGRLTGVREEGERIKLNLIPLETLWESSPDAKALSALCLYKKLAAAGELPGVDGSSPPARASKLTIIEHEKSVRFLQRVGLLKGLSEEELLRTAAAMERIEFEDGAVIMKEGDTGDDMFILESGGAAAERFGQVVWNYYRGDWFGELALLNDAPRSATVRSVGSSALHRLGRTAFAAFEGKCAVAFTRRQEQYVSTAEGVPQHKRGRLRAASSTLTPAQAQAQAEISEMRLTQRRLQERVQSAAQYGATIAQQQARVDELQAELQVLQGPSEEISM